LIDAPGKSSMEGYGFPHFFSPLKDEELKDKSSIMLMRWGWTIDVYSLAVEEMN